MLIISSTNTDVVAAHKRLLKEKEALDLSLRAMSKTSTQEIPIDSTDDEIPTNVKVCRNYNIIPYNV